MRLLTLPNLIPLPITSLVGTSPYMIRAVFNQVSKVIKQLLWFCIATVCDWLKNLAPLS